MLVQKIPCEWIRGRPVVPTGPMGLRNNGLINPILSLKISVQGSKAQIKSHTGVSVLKIKLNTITNALIIGSSFVGYILITCMVNTLLVDVHDTNMLVYICPCEYCIIFWLDGTLSDTDLALVDTCHFSVIYRDWSADVKTSPGKSNETSTFQDNMIMVISPSHPRPDLINIKE